MDWFTFLSKMTSHLAWPGVILFLLWLLKPYLGGLAKRLDEITLPGGAKAKFRQELNELETSSAAAAKEAGELPPRETRLPNAQEDERLDTTIRSILEQAGVEPKIALLSLSAELEKQGRQALATRGLLRERPVVAVSQATSELQQYGFPPNLSGSLRLFDDIRNKILHGGTSTDDEVLSAIDSGITILRVLNVLPNETNIIHQTGVPLFSDPECTAPVPDAKGIILETTSPGGALKTLRIFPTTRTHFRPGRRVAWEWNMQRGWPATWYKDPATGEIKQAWLSSAEFVGRDLDDV